MSVLDFGLLDSANRGFRALFFQTLEFEEAEVMRIINLLCMVVSSNSSIEEYNWSEAVASMVEWVDERPINRLAVQKLTITNLDFANGIEVDRNDLMDDKLGLIRPRIQTLAMAAARHKMDLLRDLLNLGHTTGLSYDGVSMFDNSHPRRDGGTQDNDESGSGILADASFRTGVTKLETLTDERGEFLNNKFTHLIVGPENRFVAAEILNAERSASGATNITRGMGQFEMINGITTAHFFLGDLSKPLKPFIFQERTPVQFTDMSDPDDEQHFHRKKMFWGADYRGNMAYGHWQLMVGSDGT